MNIQVKLLKRLDNLVGPLAVRMAAPFLPRAVSAAESPSSILFVRPGGMGDAVLLLPAIGVLRRTFPQARIDILCERRNHEVFRLSGELDGILLYDRPSDLVSLLGRRYDAVIDTEQWYRLSALIPLLTGARVRIGFGTNERARLLTHPISYREETYELESFLELVAPLTGSKDPASCALPFLSVADEARREARGLLASLNRPRTVALFPGGSTPEKRWGGERFREAASRLAGEGIGVVVIGGRAEAADGGRISEGLEGVLDLTGTLSLSRTAALLREVSLLITGDSGIMHLAYALGTATVSLFGPGNSAKWAPRGGLHAVLSAGVACSPCTRFGHTPPCRHDFICMERIGAGEVVGKAIEMLER